VSLLGTSKFQIFGNQELIACRYTSGCSSCWDDVFKKLKDPSFEIE